MGPGRVGSALGRRWAAAGVDLLGYVGRGGGRAAAAARFAGRGRALGPVELGAAQVVVFAVGDPDLAAAVAAAAQAARVRAGSLWLHTSGRHDLGVLAPAAAAGARVGALHPVVPFPDAETGLRGLAGRAAVLLGEGRARRTLVRLCRLLGMVPLAGRDGDRTLYHAACALAANGLTALRGAVDRAFAASAVLAPADAALVAGELMAAALEACRAQGPAAALSGPVVRGDAATVAAHRAALRRAAADLEDVYCALMTQALELARQRGLAAPAAADLRRALGGG